MLNVFTTCFQLYYNHEQMQVATFLGEVKFSFENFVHNFIAVQLPAARN